MASWFFGNSIRKLVPKQREISSKWALVALIGGERGVVQRIQKGLQGSSFIDPQPQSVSGRLANTSWI